MGEDAGGIARSSLITYDKFIRHYLPSLQERQKQRKDTKQLDVGQVVLIVDPQLPRAL